MKCLIYILFLALPLGAIGRVSGGFLPPTPDEGDADAFMESIGKYREADRLDEFTNEASRNPSREDLGGGKLSSSLGTYDEAARGVVIQTNGQVVVAGRYNNSSGSGSADDFIILRYDPDGGIDATFGTNGRLIVDFSAMADTAHAITLQTDGKLIVIGKADIGAQFYSDFAIARLTSTGSLDTTFSTDGKVTTAIGLSQDVARAGIQDTTGRLVIAGYTWDRTNTDYDGAIVRYNSDGTLDTTFRTNGKLTQAISTGDDFTYGITLISDGRLAVGGADYSASWTYQTYTTGSGTWTVPGGGPYTVSVELIGGGGGGGAGENGPGSGEWGGGGGGGSYVKHVVANVASGTNLAYLVGTGGSGQAIDSDLSGGDGTASTCTTYTLSAGGGGGGGAFSSGSGAGGSAGVASGGNTTNTNGSAGVNEVGSGDGGAAAGPVGVAGAAQTVDGAAGNNYGGGGASSDETPGDTGSGAGGWVRFGYLGGGTWDFTAARYMSNGTVDTTFFTTGSRVLPVQSSTDISWGIAAWGEQLILAGESDNGSNADFAVVRLISNGTLDTTFKTTGKNTHTLGTGSDVVYAVMLQTDGKPIVSGYYNNGSNNDFALTRYQSNGTFDTSFNSAGKKFDAIGAASDVAAAMSLLGDDYLVLAGRTTNASSNLDIAVARYQTNGTLAQSGKIDMGFGTNGSRKSVFVGNEQGDTIVPTQDGKLVIFDWSTIIRLEANGTLDTSFFTTGNAASTLYYNFGGLIQTDARIVAVGGRAPLGDYDYSITRFMTNGTVDTSFSTDGFDAQINFGNMDHAFAVTQQSNGKLVSVGCGLNWAPVRNYKVYWDGAERQIIARYETNGTFDTSFQTVGYFLYTINRPGLVADGGCSYSVSIQSDGKFVASGSDSSPNAIVIRLETNGTLDTAFWTAGAAHATAPGMVAGASRSFGHSIGTDGRITVGGDENGQKHFAVRLHTNGAVDTSFNTRGSASAGTYSGYAMTMQANRKTIVAGVDAPGDRYNFSIMRFSTSGNLDTSFNTTGKATLDISGAGQQDLIYTITIKQNGKICGAGFSDKDAINDPSIVCWWP